MATTINAGRVRFVSRGTYNNSTQYYLFDLVDYNGSSYIAKENTLGNLPTNTQYWQLIAEKGNTGSTGQTGPVGATGNGISSITKTGTSGLVDTYTITYTNGNTTTFTITNGEDGEVTETELNVLREKVADQQKVIDQLPQVTGQGTEITLENTIEAQFTKFDVEGNSVQDGTPSPDNEVPILSAGDNGSINEKIINKNVLNYKEMFNNAEDYSSAFKIYRKKLQPNTSYTTSSNFPYTDTETGFIIVNSTDEPSTVNYGLRGEITTTTNSDGIICIYIRTFSAQQIIPILENFESGTYYIQTELGSTATSYVPHKEQDYSIFVQQPMRSIGDVRDCFVKKSDGWYERHYIGEVVLDGTEYWELQNNCFTINISDIKKTPNYGDRRQLITISNYYIAQTSEYRGQMLDLRVCKTIDPGLPRQIAIKDTSKTLAEFKALLAEKYASGNPVYVNYLLAEPLDLPCTEEQIVQLENLPSTYKDFTIINSEDETPAYLEVAGIYDLNNLINN